MDKDYLRARIASIQAAFEAEVYYLEIEIDRPFEEQSIDSLRATWGNVKRRVEKLNEYVKLLQETQEWLK